MNTEHTVENTKRKKTRKEKILFITQLAVLLSIEILLCFTPYLGFIPIGGTMEIVIFLIPVIIGSIVLGPTAGGILGFFGGLTCFIFYTVAPYASFNGRIMYTPFNGSSYWTIVVCFVPRIIMGIIPGVLYKYGKKAIKNDYVRTGIACFLGSITNTILVLFGTYFLWGKDYAAISSGNMSYSELFFGFLFLTFTAGLLEAIVTTIVGIPICKALFTIIKKNSK